MLAIQISKRHAHHGDRAGYNLLTRHSPGCTQLWAPEGPNWRRINGLSRRLMRPLSGSTWFGLGGLLTELRAALQARAARPERVPIHCLYGEDLLGLLPLIRSLSQAPIVATFHQPPERIQALLSPQKLIGQLDAAIVLDASNAAFLEPYLPGRVHSLWLGVDTDFWKPGPPQSPGTQGRILSVGGHLRDFALMRQVIQRLGPEGFQFDLVLPKARAEAFQGLPGVRCHVGISDAALLALYQASDLHFLPLQAASANNALLQAMASGLVTVASRLPGLLSYLPETAGRFFEPGQPESAIAAIREVLASPEAQIQAREAARNAALERSWPQLAARHEAIYRSLAADR